MARKLNVAVNFYQPDITFKALLYKNFHFPVFNTVITSNNEQPVTKYFLLRQHFFQTKQICFHHLSVHYNIITSLLCSFLILSNFSVCVVIQFDHKYLVCVFLSEKMLTKLSNAHLCIRTASHRQCNC